MIRLIKEVVSKRNKIKMKTKSLSNYTLITLVNRDSIRVLFTETGSALVEYPHRRQLSISGIRPHLQADNTAE